MVEFFMPWVGWRFRANLVAVQKAESDLGVNLVCGTIGLVIGVNIEKEVCKFVKDPCRD